MCSSGGFWEGGKEVGREKETHHTHTYTQMMVVVVVVVGFKTEEKDEQTCCLLNLGDQGGNKHYMPNPQGRHLEAFQEI